MKVANAFGGRVVGYYSSNNKSASIGGDRCEGHDFAIIGDRFIVDYWAFRIAGLADRPVFDLNKLEEREKAELLFGREDNWRDVFVWSGGGPGNVTV
ncbi:MAG: hypothetical protein HY736_23825 [Verrucomicrobia bacterium]|nr:hypothetical protein [Verrucomicrobiota bacterium]